MPEANPTWWLNYVYGTQPDGRSSGGGAGAERRRLIMHRWGGMGNQRYPIGFSGDVTSSWASLGFQPSFTSMAANVNFGYWSHDVGGFYEPPEPELYVRWVQLGALSPIFRAHGFRASNVEKRMWRYPDQHFIAMRSALRLRIELLPHLYTAARRARLTAGLRRFGRCTTLGRPSTTRTISRTNTFLARAIHSSSLQ